MVPFVIAGGVIVGASVIAWHYNQKTDEERGRQKRAYRDRDRMRSNYKNSKAKERQKQKEEEREQASRYKELMLKEISIHKRKIEPISLAYKSFYDLVKREIEADSTSPFRKNALSREFARIEDGQLRLKEYENYLIFEDKKINELWNDGSYGWLMERSVPDALLPMEWLYPGKLLLVEFSDIDSPLKQTRHILKFNGFNGDIDKQKALAVGYGDEFPMLVIGKSKHGSQFFGCVAKGIVYHDHIRTDQALPMMVERPIKNGFLCTYADGLVRATLPSQNLKNPSLKLLGGQRIDVYYDHYDATLTYDPMRFKEADKKKNPSPVVTEKEPRKLGDDSFELYIEINTDLLSGIPENNDFYSSNTRWTLLSYDHDSKEICLGKANVEIKCHVSAENDGLVASKAYLKELPQVGIDLPFSFILASDDTNVIDLLGWKYGIEQFIGFVYQASINSTESKERVKQSEFFRQWERVIKYQRTQESERTIEFECEVEVLERNNSLLILDKTLLEDTEIDNKSVYHFIQKIQGSEYLKAERSCKLQIFNKVTGEFLPAIFKQKIRSAEYTLEIDCIEIRCSLNKYKDIDLREPQIFRLTVSLPNSSLQRQEQALDALFEDRLAEPRIKDIFLSPSTYRPAFIGNWHDSSIPWNNTNLTDNQKESIKTTLSAKYLAMLQGPPGTGKTTVIVEMLFQLLSQYPDQRILVVSQQNTAVDNAIEKFKNKYPELVNSSVKIVRVGNPDKISDELKDYQLSSIYKEFLTENIDSCASRLPDNSENDIPLNMWRSLLMEELQTHSGSSSNARISDEFFTTMLSDKNLIGATCVGLAGRKAGVDSLTFDVVIMDEAGRATIPEMLIPLLRAKKAILIGDHHQLPPSIAPVLRDDSAKDELKFLEDTFLETSFFERLFDDLPEECTAKLSEQFRMASPIGDLVADLFYTKNGERQLFNGDKDNDSLDEEPACVFPEALLWLDVPGKQLRKKTSLENRDEAKAIKQYLIGLSNDFDRKIDVAIITPYGAQKKLIKKLLGFEYDSDTVIMNSLSIKVDTVDGFQGSEAELVCYSTVRTEGSLQFLLDKKRLNVACSRAKENLIFFGNSRYLSKPGRGRKNYFQDIVERSSAIRWNPQYEGYGQIHDKYLKSKKADVEKSTPVSV